MRQADIAARLVLIEESQARIELALATRVPAADIRVAIEDVFQTYGLVVQLKEIYDNQRDQLIVLIGLAAQLVADTREGDQELRDLLVQLRELGRKHVRGLADLERAADWHEKEAERRDVAWGEGEAERRQAG